MKLNFNSKLGFRGSRRLGAALVSATLSLALVAVAAPAHATPTIAGWTQEEFISAAEAHGVDEGLAIAAWADPALLPSIAVEVSVTGTEERPSAQASALMVAPRAYTPYYAAKTVSFKNIFGATLCSVRLIKTWTANGVSVIKGAAAYTPTAEGAFGVGVDGEVASNEYYVSVPGHPNGGHTSGRVYSFSLFGIPGTYTLGVSITGTFDGTFGASTTGGN